MIYQNHKYKFGLKQFLCFILVIQILLIINFLNYKKRFPNKKRVGVVNLPNFRNVGNILVKFAMFKILEDFGFNATIIAPRHKIPQWNGDISFLNKAIKFHSLVVNANFYEVKEDDYDYLIVNSDQTWGFYKDNYFYNVALLKFSENWTVHKFIYATSMGRYSWYFKKTDEKLFKKLLKNFSGISFREIGTVKILKKHLGLESVFVLDPTLLIDKLYYLNEIKNFKPNFPPSEKFIFVYQLDKNDILDKIIKDSSEKFNYKIYKHFMWKSD